MTQGSVRRKQPQPGSTITTAPAPAAASATDGENDVTNGDAQSGGRNTGGVGGGGDGSTEGRATRGTRRWGYRRGPREQLRRNLFGRFAPVFFYPLAQVCVPIRCCCCCPCEVSLHFFVLVLRMDRVGWGGMVSRLTLNMI